MRLLSVLFFALCMTANAEVVVESSRQGSLIIRADFKAMNPIYLEGAPVGKQGGILVEGHPSDFEVKVSGLEKSNQILNDQERTPFMPCRCPGNTVKSLTQVSPQSVSAYELRFLGDFRGKPLSKLTLRSSALRDEVITRYQSMTVELSRRDQARAKSVDINSLALSDSLVIVTPSKWLSSVQELARVISGTGVKVSVKTLENFGPTFWDLKRSFKSLYEREKFGHALLIGDEDNFPTEFVQTSTDFQTPSDLQYYLMGDGSDRIPDVMGARLAVRAQEQIDQYRQKLSFYLSSKASKHSIAIASDEGMNPTDVEYARAMLAPLKNHYSHQVTEVFQADSTTGADYLVSKLNQGADLVNYIGHGSGPSWPSLSGREFDLQDIENLTAGNGHYVLIDVACQNGRFSDDGRLGVHFMNQLSGSGPVGSIVYYGGSVDISWHPPAVMAVAINEDIATNKGASIGEHILRGQLKLIENYDDLESALENLVWYHLQGVPTLVAHF